MRGARALNVLLPHCCRSVRIGLRGWSRKIDALIPVLNIAQLNAELKTTVVSIYQLPKVIDAIVAEIKGTEFEGDAA